MSKTSIEESKQDTKNSEKEVGSSKQPSDLSIKNDSPPVTEVEANSFNNYELSGLISPANKAAIDKAEIEENTRKAAYDRSSSYLRKIAALLLDEEADVNKDDNKKGLTPLILCVINSNQIAFEPSEKAGKEKNSVEKSGWKAAIIKLLERGAEVNALDNQGSSALMFAAVKNDVEIMRLLLKFGAEIENKNHSGKTALSIAIAWGHKEAINFLVEQGANTNIDLNYLNDDDLTPLMIAVEKNDLELVNLLIKLGADVNLKNKDDETALTIAIANQKEELNDDKEKIANKKIISTLINHLAAKEEEQNPIETEEKNKFLYDDASLPPKPRSAKEPEPSLAIAPTSKTPIKPEPTNQKGQL
jgi:ankyrin repeat protein